MKQWKVDNYVIGPAVDAEYDNTAEMLADVLNGYEKAGAVIREITETERGNFRVIYTVEDIDADKPIFGI